MKETLEDKPCFIDIGNFEISIIERNYDVKKRRFVDSGSHNPDIIILKSDEWRLQLITRESELIIKGIISKDQGLTYKKKIYSKNLQIKLNIPFLELNIDMKDLEFIARLYYLWTNSASTLIDLDHNDILQSIKNSEVRNQLLSNYYIKNFFYSQELRNLILTHKMASSTAYIAGISFNIKNDDKSLLRFDLVDIEIENSSKFHKQCLDVRISSLFATENEDNPIFDFHD